MVPDRLILNDCTAPLDEGTPLLIIPPVPETLRFPLIVNDLADPPVFRFNKPAPETVTFPLIVEEFVIYVPPVTFTFPEMVDEDDPANTKDPPVTAT